MASGDTQAMSEETYEYICTSCAEDDLIKEALKYCVDCQRYCCKDCLTFHTRIPSLREHTFLDNSAVKPQGQPRSLPAFPTKQCGKHTGKIIEMYCGDHDDVCCCVCAAEDHRLCKDIVSVSNNIDRLYSKSDTARATFALTKLIDDMTAWQTNTDTLPRRLRDSKAFAIKAVSDFRNKMEKFLKKLEEASIKMIENEYKKLELQLREERRRLQDSIDDLKDLKQLLRKASGNVAQQFVCTKLVEKKYATIENDEMNVGKFSNVEIKFLPSKELKSSIGKMVHLGEASAISARQYSIYDATTVNSMNVKLNTDSNVCSIRGSCIVDDTVLFTDYNNKKLKRFDIKSSSLVDYCNVPDPQDVCKVEENEVAVTCKNAVQFVSTRNMLSLSRSIKTQHKSYGIAHNDNKLYITDEGKSLYMYDMSGNLLKTVTTDLNDQSLFGRCNHIAFNAKNGRLFVGDDLKGLVCLNADGDYIDTILDPSGKPSDVVVDGYGNVIISSSDLKSILQCNSDGLIRGTIVNATKRKPQSLCIHQRRRKLFVGNHNSNTVEVFDLTWKNY